MKKKLYAAYGSNLNIRQMAYRCPGAKLIGAGVIPGYKLQFKGQRNGAFATISPKEGAEVPVAVWSITQRDELSLDRYEGFPSHYFKQDVPVRMDGRELSVMAYIMDLRMDFGVPTPWYYETVAEGYQDCGLDESYLKNALKMSLKNVPPGFFRQEYQDEVEPEDEPLEEQEEPGFSMQLM